jgi:peptidoglycan hydrolase-like protein with peptidoglycan-binding domain
VGTAVAITVPAAYAAGTCNQTTMIYRQVGTRIPSSGQDIAGLSCSLAQGNTGPAVQRLQENLNLCYRTQLENGYNGIARTGRLTTDGQFGALTKRALQIAQSVEGISADGSYASGRSGRSGQAVPAADASRGNGTWLTAVATGSGRGRRFRR